MERRFTIGEIGRIFNLSKDTLRYYDDIGLLSPWEIGKNGYRYYTRAQFDMISTVIFLRNAGMPIKEIKDITTQDDIGSISNKLKYRKSEVVQRISELQKTLLRLDIMQDHLQSITSAHEITTEKISELWLLSEEMTVLDELNVDELGVIHDERVREWLSYATVMSTIEPEVLLAGKFHQFKRYGYVSEHPFPIDDRHVKKIEDQLFLCINTTVRSNLYEEKDPAYKKLLKHIETFNMEIAGETIERNMFDLYNPEKKEFTHFFKVYVPIKS